ncbi:MAG: stage 0 sporulation protein, partial [Clostridia bacterium]|nr:stage 0 sporulation protein [Clostridia bacterium]
SEIVSPLKPVVRVATEEDERRHEQNKAMEEKARQIFLEKVRKNGLEMQLVDVEYTFDNSKLIFYFTADGRVDFRELVKDLASVFRTRIELRQIGVRDEAKLIGGLGVCGRPFCCKEFLPDFAQVSIKMAKEQNLSLSSTKISGSCGRLMCCLRFEQEVYETEYATFPKVDSIVETPAGKGVIIESSFLTGKIKVKLNGDQNAPAKFYTKDDIKVIGMIKRNDEGEELKKLEE